MFCTCETPITDVDHDAGCRRCGLDINWAPLSLDRAVAVADQVTASLDETDRVLANPSVRADRLTESEFDALIAEPMICATCKTELLDPRETGLIYRACPNSCQYQ